MKNLWKGFEARPKDPVLFARLRASLVEGDEVDDLVRLYMMRAETAKPLEAIFLHLAVVEVWAERAQNREAAHRSLAEIFRRSASLENATRDAVREATEELLYSLEDWDGVAVWLEAKVQECAPDNPQRPRLLKDLGALTLKTLHKPSAAAPALRDAVLFAGAPLDEDAREALTVLGDGFVRDPSNDDLFNALCATFDVWVRSAEDAEEAVAWVSLRLEHDASPSKELLITLAKLQATYFEAPYDAALNATLALESGADPEAILEIFQTLDSRFPQDPRVLRGLIQTQKQLGLWAQAMESIEGLAAFAETPKQQCALFCDNARIALHERFDTDTASAWLERAWAADPTGEEEILELAQQLFAQSPHHAPTHDLFIRIHTELERPEPILEDLRGRLEHAVRPQDRIQLLTRIATTQRVLASRPEEALVTLTEAVALREDSQDLTDALSEMALSGYYRDEVQALLHTVCARQGVWEPLLDVFEELLQGAADAEERASLYVDLGHIFEREVGDFPKALTHYQCAFHEDPTREDALEGGRRVFEDQGDFGMVSRLLDMHIQISSNPRDVASYFAHKADVQFRHLHDLPRALEALGHAVALEAPREILAELVDALVIAQRPMLPAALESLEHAWGNAQRTSDAQAFLWTLADFLWDLSSDANGSLDSESATQSACDLELRGVRLEPNAVALERAHTRVYAALQRLERWEDVAELLGLEASVASTPEERIALWMRQADVHNNRLSSPDRVVELCSSVLEAQPDHEEAFRLMLSVFLENASAQERIELLTWGLENVAWAQPQHDLQAHAELHTLLTREQLALDHVDDAVQWVHRFAQDQPNHPAIFTFFESDVHRPTEHLRALEHSLTVLADPNERLARHLDIAELCAREHLPQDTRVEHIRAALELDRTSPLEPAERVEKARVLDARTQLLALHVGRGESVELVNLLGEEIEDVRTSRERLLEALLEHAERALELDPPAWASARASLARRIALTPQDHALRCTLFVWSRIHEEPPSEHTLEALNQLIDSAVEHQRTSVSDHRFTASFSLYNLHVQRAQLLGELGRGEHALDALPSVLEEYLEERLETIDAFRPIATAHNLQATLLEHLEGLLPKLASDDERVQLLGVMARIALHDGKDPSQSLALQERALALQPDNLNILLGVEEALEHAGHFDRLAVVLQGHLDLVQDPTERSHLRRHISRTHLLADQPDEALRELHTLLRESPHDVEGHRALLDFHENREEWPLVSQTLDALLPLETDPETRHALHHKRASLHLETLQDTARAIRDLEELIQEFSDDQDALETLQNLYTQGDAHADLTRILLQRAQHHPDTAQQRDFLLRAATLQHDALETPSAAVESLSKARDLDPNHRPTLLHLERLYTELENHTALLDVLRDLVRTTPSSQDAIARQFQIFHLQRGPLQAPADAFETLETLHETYPEEDTHRALMVQHSEENPSLWPAYADVLRNDLALSPPREEALTLRDELATVLAEKLDDLSAAYEVRTEIFETLRPEHTFPFEPLHALAERDTSLFLPLSDLYASVAHEVMDPAQSTAFLYTRAQIQEDHLNLPDRAFQTLVEALRSGWNEDETLALLYGLTHRTQLWNSLLEFNQERWREWEDQPRTRAEILLDCAEIFQHHTHQTPQAIDALLMAQQILPEHAPSRTFLEALLTTPAQWRRLEEILDAHALSSVEEGNEERALVFLERISAIRAEHIGSPSEAFDTMMRAFNLNPTRPQTRTLLRTYGQQCGRLRECVLALRDFAARSTPSNARTALLEAAQLLDRELHDLQAAVLVIHQVRSLSPEDPEAYTLLEDLLIRLQDRESLVALYSEELTPQADRATHHRVHSKLASLFEEDDPARAVEGYVQALRFDSRNLETLHKLADLYTVLQEPDATARTLEQILETDPAPHERARVLQQLTGLYIQLQRPRKALNAARNQLVLEPLRLDVFDTIQHLTAQVARPQDLLQTLLQRIEELDALIQESQDDALSSDDNDAATSLDLEDIEELDQTSAVRPPPTPEDPDSFQQPSTRDLLETQHRRLTHAARVALHEANDPTTALHVLRRITQRFTHDRDALKQLATLLEAQGLYTELRSALTTLLESVESPQEHVERLQAIARIDDEHLDQPTTAIETLRTLQELPEHPALPTLQWLAALQMRTERWEDALTSTLDAAHLQTQGPPLPPSKRAELFVQAANILENHLDDRDRAREEYANAYEALPTHLGARQALMRFAQDAGDWETQASLLRDEADQHTEPHERARSLWTLGTLLRTQSPQPLDAIPVFHDALHAQPDSIPALRDLADVAYHHRAWSDAASALQRLLDGSFARIDLEKNPLSASQLVTHESPDEPVFVLYTTRLAFCLEALGQSEDALQTFQHAARLRSTNPAVQLAIGRLSFRHGTLDVTNRTLLRLVQTQLDSLTPEERAQTFLLLARVAISLKQDKKARDFVHKGLAHQPNHIPSLRLRLELALSQEDHEDAVETLHLLVEELPTTTEKVPLLLQRADLQEHALNQPTQALRSYQRIAELQPDHPETHHHILRLSIHLELWQEASQIAQTLLDQDAARLDENPALLHQPSFRQHHLSLLVSRADLLSRGLSQHDEALAISEHILSIQPDHPEALSLTAQILAEQRNYTRLLTFTQTLLDTLPPSATEGKKALLFRLIQVFREDPQHHHLTPDLIESALRIDPNQPDLLLNLAQTHTHTENHLEALSALRRLVTLGHIDEHTLRLLHTSLEQAGFQETAFQTLRLIEFCRCATPDEQQHIRSHRVQPEALVDHALGDHQPSLFFVRHPLTTSPVAHLMRFALRNLLGLVLQSPTQAGVSNDNRIESSRKLNVVNLYKDLLRSSDLTDPEVYFTTGKEPPKTLASHPPALILQDGFLRGMLNREQRFAFARALETLRPLYVLTTALPDPDFAALYETLLERGLGQRLNPTTSAPDTLRTWHAHLDEYLDPEADQELARIVQNIQENCTYIPSAEDWKRAVRLSVLRAAMIATADITVVLKRLLREDTSVRTPTIRSCEELVALMDSNDEIAEAIRFFLSEEYTQGRAALTDPTQPLQPPHPDIYTQRLIAHARQHPTPETGRIVLPTLDGAPAPSPPPVEDATTVVEALERPPEPSEEEPNPTEDDALLPKDPDPDATHPPQPDDSQPEPSEGETEEEEDEEEEDEDPISFLEEDQDDEGTEESQDILDDVAETPASPQTTDPSPDDEPVFLATTEQPALPRPPQDPPHEEAPQGLYGVGDEPLQDTQPAGMHTEDLDDVEVLGVEDLMGDLVEVVEEADSPPAPPAPPAPTSPPPVPSAPPTPPPLPPPPPKEDPS